MPKSSICCAAPCRNRAASAGPMSRPARPGSDECMSPNDELTALQRNWTPPAELSGSATREIRLSAGGKALAVLVALIFAGAIAAGVGLSHVIARQETARQALRQGSAEVEAVVTRHWRAGGESNTPKVSYQFDYAGRTYHGSSNAPGRIWRTLSVGSPITVRFAPSTPEINHSADWEVDVLQ